MGRLKGVLDRISPHKKLLLSIISCLLLIVAGVVAALISLTHSRTPHAVIRSAVDYNQSYLSVTQEFLKWAADGVERSQNAIERAASSPGTSWVLRSALLDCSELAAATLDQLQQLRTYLDAEQNSDAVTYLTAFMTGRDTCEDSISEASSTLVLKVIIKLEKLAESLFGKALAKITDHINNHNATATATAVVKGSKPGGRRLLGAADEGGWPEWLCSSERRLLESPFLVRADAVVAQDGSGNYTTVTEAVANAPTKSEQRYVIKINAGVYKENVVIPHNKTSIMFLGEGRNNTIITASQNVADGVTTYRSATVAVSGKRFMAVGITIRNTAGPAKHQAVALRLSADLSIIYDCEITAYQDTLYVHSFRQFYRSCLIAGTVDFIFGNAAVVLQDCDIRAVRPDVGQKNTMTAQGRKVPDQNTGIVLQNCDIGATEEVEQNKSAFPTYLGRPWKQYSRTVVTGSRISGAIRPEGWLAWNESFALDTLLYVEFNNSGPGANTSSRVPWPGFKVMTSAAEALPYTAGNFISAGEWLNGTGVPFNLGF